MAKINASNPITTYWDDPPRTGEPQDPAPRGKFALPISRSYERPRPPITWCDDWSTNPPSQTAEIPPRNWAGQKWYSGLFSAIGFPWKECRLWKNPHSRVGLRFRGVVWLAKEWWESKGPTLEGWLSVHGSMVNCRMVIVFMHFPDRATWDPFHMAELYGL